MYDLRPLNNCEVFNQLRIELTNFHNNTKALNRFCFYSGNEPFIKDLAQRVLDVLVEHGLVELTPNPSESDKVLGKPVEDADPNQLRGTLMYLVLNSSLGGCKPHDLGRCNPQVVHLLQQLPEQLPQLVTVSLALLCGLEQQLFEFLACGPHWLTSQYFDCFNDVLGHVVPDKRQTLPLIGGAVSAVTKNLCYYAPPVGTVMDAIIWSNTGANVNLVENAFRLLQRQLLDSEDRLRTLRLIKIRNRYLGEAMCQLLNIMLEILASLEEQPHLPDYFQVYALRSPATQPVSKHPLEEAKPKLRAFASKMMDRLQSLLQHISVETYMYWQDMSSGELLFHLQAYVCNKCQRLANSLAKDSTLKTHPLCAQLSNFTDGAQTFEQRLETLTLGNLLGFLDGEMGNVSSEQLLAGLEELLKRPICFGSEECVESMSRHIGLLTPAHAELMLEHLAQAMVAKQLAAEEEEIDDEEDDKNAPYGELLRDVLLPIFRTRADIQQKVQLLQRRDQLQLLKHYSFEGAEHSSRRIFFFNQLSFAKERFPLDQFLDLCYEQPAPTWLALAQLAMVHRRYAALYWHVAARCAPHAVHHVASTVSSLMQDERLISQPQPRQPNADLLLRLYEQPVLLNGMRYRQVVRCRRHRFSCVLRPFRMHELQLNLNVAMLPYSARELQQAQDNYLSACAAGLAKFTEISNSAALERLMRTLFSLDAVENRIKYFSRRSLKMQNKRVLSMAATSDSQRVELARKKLSLARAYVELHGPLGSWRISHWPLVSQIILTMDQLRCSLDHFEHARLAVLDLVIEYYIKNMTHSFLLSQDLQCKVQQLINSSVEHKHVWRDGQLALLLDDAVKPREASECLILLMRASTMEAVKLLTDAVRCGIDGAVMNNLDQEVELLDCEKAQSAYGFLFKCYMRAFRQELIVPAKSSDYPHLIKHLLRTPKLAMPENLSAALGNLEILLSPAGLVSKDQIMQHVRAFLALSAEN